MIVLILGIVLFAALHVVAVVPAWKQRLKAQVGERLYGSVYGGLSIVALLVIVLGWRSADFVPVYDPQPFGWYVNYVLTFFAFLLAGVFLFRGSWRQRLRFPAAYATILWATGHLFANGDLRSLILFGGLMASAVLMLVLGYRNGIRPTVDVRAGHDGLSLLAGAALYAVMIQLHGVIIGVPVFALS